MMETSQKDHRTRVGADRRARTRYRLIEAAIPVFAEKGVEAPVIDDVIRIAGVSRGTFYNHFRSNQDLLLALNDQLREELLFASGRMVAGIEDPAARIALSLGMLLGFARDNPLLPCFVTQIGVEAAGPERLLGGFMAGLIEDGIGQGRFPGIPMLPALDMVAGSVLFAFYRIAKGESGPVHGAGVVATVLRGLGLDPVAAAGLAALPVPEMEIPDDCALIKSTAKMKSAPPREA